MNALEAFVTEHILKPVAVKHGFTEIPTVTINYPYVVPHDSEIERELFRSLGISEDLLMGWSTKQTKAKQKGHMP